MEEYVFTDEFGDPSPPPLRHRIQSPIEVVSVAE